jgi:hypothetical protein
MQSPAFLPGIRHSGKSPLTGGSVWESNPPNPQAGHTGFEDRKAHQHPSAPEAKGGYLPGRGTFGYNNAYADPLSGGGTSIGMVRTVHSGSA